MTTQKEWDKVWAAVRELSDTYPSDVVVIGGVAVYLHAKASSSLPVEFTHDADMSVGLASWGDLREHYEVVINRRLSKAQITLGGVEVDLYPEHNNSLRIDFAELAMASDVIDGVRVASLGHLLLLKLNATAERWNSAHGAKDRRDVAKLLVLLEDAPADAVLSLATDADMELLVKVLKSNAFTEIAQRNAKLASRFRKAATAFVTRLAAEMTS